MALEMMWHLYVALQKPDKGKKWDNYEKKFQFNLSRYKKCRDFYSVEKFIEKIWLTIDWEK